MPKPSLARASRGRASQGAIAVALVALAASACTSSGAAVSGTHGAATGQSSPAATAAQGAAAQGGTIVPTHSALHWHACPSQGGNVECATLSVPLNYADPRGRHITLALDMVPATAPVSQQQGILLVNPGGPGGDGLPLAQEVAQGLARSVAADYDIVGFDPRGVGSSVPSLSCDPGFFTTVRPDYIPKNQAAEQVLINRARTYAQDCEKRFGWLLPYMTTEDVARDLDSIRDAFGVSQLNYFAFSYGTYIGQVYATLFPGRVRHMVLDSVVDPTGVWYNDNIQQDYAFQGRMEAFFAWAARYDGTYQLGATAAQVQAAWYRARTQLTAHPINGTNGPLIGPDEFDDTFLLGGYLDTLWPGLAQALSAYLNQGQSADMLNEFQQNGAQNENEFAVYNAVQCSDVNWPRSWAKWTADTETVYKTAPFQAWDNAWFNAACAFWPIKGPSQPLRIKDAGLPGILILQGTLDPATPYAGARNAQKALRPAARMVVVEGGGNHGQSLEQPADSCVQGYLNAYLATGALPTGPNPVNATCPPVPDPTPQG
ncbi:MAG: alpha/beta fold hydrolase [Streptosporangiaceae bacterium]|nr:alpha/beta fold hydrolase [Streptosporangiaceae bacterium]